MKKLSSGLGGADCAVNRFLEKQASSAWRTKKMPFDFECFNLDTIESKPIEEDNLEHWKKSQSLSAAMYDRWKKIADKKVIVDGVKYRLVKI